MRHPPSEDAVLPQERLEVNAASRLADLPEEDVEIGPVLEDLDRIAEGRVPSERPASDGVSLSIGASLSMCGRGSRWRLIDQMTSA